MKPEEQVSIWNMRFKKLAKEFASRDKLFDSYDQAYHGAHWLDEPDPDDIEERVTLNYDKQTVDITSSLFLADDMRIMVTPPMESQPTLKMSDQIEKFLRAALYENDLRRGRSVMGDLYFNLAQLGWAVARQLWVEDGKFPIRIQPIHPKNVYAKRHTDGYAWVIFNARRTRAEIQDEWDHFPPAKRSMRKEWSAIKWEDMQTQEVDYLDIWYTKNRQVHNLIIADKALIKPDTDESATYPQIPYYIILANPTNSTLPHMWSPSSIDCVIDNRHNMEKLVTNMNRIAAIQARLPIIAKTMETLEITADIGQVIQLKPDTNESVGYMPPPGTPPDLNNLLMFYQQQISMDAYPLSMYGNSSAMSGFAIEQLREGGRLRLWPMRRQLETALSAMFQDTIRLAYMNQPGPIDATGIKDGKPYNVQLMGEQLDGFKVHVSLPIKSPADELRKAQMATMLQALLSKRTLQENYLDVQSPEDEMDRMLGEMAMMNPQMMQAAVMLAAQKWQPELMALMQSAQQANTMNPNQPPEPNIPQIAGSPGAPVGRPPIAQESGIAPGPAVPTEPMQQGVPM